MVVVILLGLLALAVAGDPQPGPHQGEHWRMPSLPSHGELIRLTPGYWIGLPFVKTADALCHASHGGAYRATTSSTTNCSN